MFFFSSSPVESFGPLSINRNVQENLALGFFFFSVLSFRTFFLYHKCAIAQVTISLLDFEYYDAVTILRLLLLVWPFVVGNLRMREKHLILSQIIKTYCFLMFNVN